MCPRERNSPLSYSENGTRRMRQTHDMQSTYPTAARVSGGSTSRSEQHNKLRAWLLLEIKLTHYREAAAPHPQPPAHRTLPPPRFIAAHPIHRSIPAPLIPC
jgi:hypothetical protein